MKPEPKWKLNLKCDAGHEETKTTSEEKFSKAAEDMDSAHAEECDAGGTISYEQE